MPAKHPEGDRDFDQLLGRFQRNIYDSMKGRIRLAVLRRDFDEFVIGDGQKVLDVGAGHGRWAAHLLRQGHSVTLTDISPGMLTVAEQWLSTQPFWAAAQQRASFQHCALQEVDRQFPHAFDVVCCHAVLEWMERPREALVHLARVTRAGGWLSLLFYNINGVVYKNLLRGNYQKIKNNDFRGTRGSLTPLHPLRIEDVLHWAEVEQLQLICESGVRVFHDYILDPHIREANEDQILEMELALSRQPAFCRLGRYTHFLLKKR